MCLILLSFFIVSKEIQILCKLYISYSNVYMYIHARENLSLSWIWTEVSSLFTPRIIAQVMIPWFYLHQHWGEQWVSVKWITTKSSSSWEQLPSTERDQASPSPFSTSIENHRVTEMNLWFFFQAFLHKQLFFSAELLKNIERLGVWKYTRC